MTTTQITADQINEGDVVSAEFAGVVYTGSVRSIDRAEYSSKHYGSEHLLINFVGGGYWSGSDQSITVPACWTVERH